MADEFDPNSYAQGQYLDVINERGMFARTFIPGTPGTPGQWVSNAGLRSSMTSSYAQMERDRANVYGQAVKEVTNRNPGIRAGYQRGTNELRSNVKQRNAEASSANGARDADMAAAALRMGIPGPPSGNTRADSIDSQARAQYTSNADSWAGFNSGAAERAVERNNAVGDAFTWSGLQQQKALQGLLREAIATAGDFYVAGSGGTRGRSSGGTTTSQKLQGITGLRIAGNEDFKNDLSAAKFSQQGNLASNKGSTFGVNAAAKRRNSIGQVIV